MYIAKSTTHSTLTTLISLIFEILFVKRIMILWRVRTIQRVSILKESGPSTHYRFFWCLALHRLIVFPNYCLLAGRKTTYCTKTNFRWRNYYQEKPIYWYWKGCSAYFNSRNAKRRSYRELRIWNSQFTSRQRHMESRRTQLAKNRSVSCANFRKRWLHQRFRSTVK